ncbi:hypothetical protein G5V65_11365 [Rhodobacter sp. HX-7-19]|uniref:Uncharacterized protein n=1 Tax=Paragemmobacter kunshanensis TaxID=2583234 RepID=A0A6M1TXI1_9RHOB|nr:hypothetical protein [Rhodobacter kunshanensis]NGQ91496.1 hypothetical protein [Rhodobacter kunshanensis]
MTLIDKAEALAKCKAIAEEARTYGMPQMAMGAFACMEAVDALAPTYAAHVNETPKSEHDGADVLTAAQARSRCPYGATGDDCCGGYCSMDDDQEGGDDLDRRLRSHETSPGVTAGADDAQAREAAAEAMAALSWAKANLQALSCRAGNEGAEFPIVDRALASLRLALIGETSE